jgi:hypothetical protein
MAIATMPFAKLCRKLEMITKLVKLSQRRKTNQKTMLDLRFIWFPELHRYTTGTDL